MVASSKAFSCQSCYCCSLLLLLLLLTPCSLHLPWVLTFLLLLLLIACFACVLSWISALGAFVASVSVSQQHKGFNVYFWNIYNFLYACIYLHDVLNSLVVKVMWPVLLQFICTSVHIWHQIQKGAGKSVLCWWEMLSCCCIGEETEANLCFYLEKVHVEELLETVFSSVRIPSLLICKLCVSNKCMGWSCTSHWAMEKCFESCDLGFQFKFCALV